MFKCIDYWIRLLLFFEINPAADDVMRSDKLKYSIANNLLALWFKSFHRNYTRIFVLLTNDILTIVQLNWRKLVGHIKIGKKNYGSLHSTLKFVTFELEFFYFDLDFYHFLVKKFFRPSYIQIICDLFLSLESKFYKRNIY